MAKTIKWTSGIEVLGDGLQKAVARSIDVDSYGVIAVDVESNVSDLVVDIKLGSAGSLMLLAIASDKYKDITYKVGASTTSITLDHPQLFFGAGAVIFLGTDPDSLTFTNASTNEKASVQILVGRAAAP